MVKTLEELFNSSDIQSPQNPKDIRISSSDMLVDSTGFVAGRAARRIASNDGITGSNFWEQEVSGLRIIRGGAMVPLYGNEISRITLRATPTLDRIKNISTGHNPVYPNVEGAIRTATEYVNNQIGVTPAATPSFVGKELEEKHNTALVQDRMIHLSKILKTNGDAPFIFRLLRDTGGGNLKTIGTQALGSLVDIGKDKIRGVLFNPNSITPFNEVSTFRKGSNITINYGSKSDRESVTLNTDGTTGITDAGGLRYSKTLILTREGDEGISFATADEVAEDGGIVAKTPALEIDRNKITEDTERIPKFITSRYGINSKSDRLNRHSGIYEGEEAPEIDGRILDKWDIVPLKFHSVAQNKTVQFRSTITGLSETYSPNWDSANFIGSPFSYHTYTGIERTISFEFTIFSLSADEHKRAWDRLNFLTSLVYPQGYYGETSTIIPPIIKFSLGDMYKGKVGFIDGLGYSYEDNVGWQIDDTETNTDGDEVNMKGYRLPMMINVTGITIKFIESRGVTAGRRYYSFNPQT